MEIILPKNIEQIVIETKQELTRIFKERLKKIILFGSYARGEFTGQSDIDLALLLIDMQNSYLERKKYLSQISSLCLKHDIVISIIPFEFKEFDQKKIPLIVNIRREGIPL